MQQKNTVGSRVRHFRRKAGLTLQELSDRLKDLPKPLTPSHLDQIENRQRKVYDFHLFALAHALGVKASDLIGRSRKK